MPPDPWEWSIEDVIQELCHPQGQLRSQYPNLQFNSEELETSLRSNGIDGETLLVALTKDTLKQDLDIASLGLRFKIWKVIESARLTSLTFQAFRAENSDKFAESFNLASAPESSQLQPRTPSAIKHYSGNDTQPEPTKDKDVLSHDPPHETSVNIKTHRGEHVFFEESGRKRRKLTLAPKVGIYLDDHATPVDSVFYGTSPFDEEVDLGVRGRDEELQRESTFNWNEVGSDSTLTHFEHYNRPKPGQSRYISRLMQRYLLGSNARQPRYFQRDDAFAVGLQPLPASRVQSSLSTPSLSVVLNEADGPVAYRARAKDWKYDAMYTKETHKATFSTRRKNFQTSMNLEDWSFLDKYIAGNDSEDVMPLYGESGSEGSFDTETWEEMEAERLAKATERPSSFLNLDNVKTIIEEQKAAMRTDWASKKLPVLQSRAWKIWSRSHLQSTLEADIGSLEKEMTRLLERLRKFEENICEMSWTKSSEVKVQCQSLQPTVVDMQAAQWTIDLLQQPNAPPKTQELAEPRSRVRIQPGDLADDEEELTDSEFDAGFMIDDASAVDEALLRGHREERVAEDTEMASVPDEDLTLQDGIHAGEQLTEATNLAENIQDESSGLQEPSPKPLDSATAVEPVKPLPLFKMPREIQSNLPQEGPEIISLSSSENDTATDGDGSNPNRDLDIQSVTKKQLRKLTWNEINKTGSAQLKLAWIMTRQSSSNDKILELLELDTAPLLSLVCEGYKSLLGHSYKKIRSMPADVKIDSRCVFTLGLWFIAWSKNTIWSIGADLSPEGIRRDLLEQVVADWPPSIEEWQIFVAFVKERVAWISKRDHKASNTIKERGKSTRAHFNSYKRPLPGQSQRESARERQLAAQLRREQLQTLLDNSFVGDSALDAIVNLDKTREGELIRINPHIASRMKPHQLEGVQFMWTELVASTANEGCLLAQPMGMGKTMQVIAFLLTIAEAAKSTLSAIHEQIPRQLRRTYSTILAPPSLVENWYDELLKWLPFDSAGTIGEIYKVTNALTVSDRISTVKEWNQQGGVLLLSSSFFRQAVLEEPAENQPYIYGEISSILRARPSVVVVDEAQELKNATSKLSLAVRQVTTRARIAMTGSPLANNLVEYFNLVDFVAEGYLGTMQDFRARYVTPITEGQYADALRSSQRRALKMQKVLTQDLAPKIHRAEIAQLHQQLHGKTEFIIRVQLTDLQRRCYALYIESIQRQESDVIQMPRLWAFLSILKLLCNHPKCFHDKLLSQGAERTTHGSETDQLNGNGRYASTFEATDEQSEALAQNPMALLENDMLRRQLQILKQPESLDSPSLSNKMIMLFQIVALCLQWSEKLLIFSHSIPSMDYIECQLRSMNVKMIRIDGSAKVELRQEQTKRFNEGDDQVALVSTRAGGVGLNLFGASRVVIVDDWFNPILEQQAIGRAYRIGQAKHVFVYRLIAAGSFEEELQNQALFKVGLANRIVDKKDTVRAASRNAQTWLRPPRVGDSEDLSEATNRDNKVLERILQDGEIARAVQSIKLGDSFLIEENEELTLEEQQDAARMIHEEQLRRTDPVAYEQWKAAQQAVSLRESAIAVASTNHDGLEGLNGTNSSFNPPGPLPHSRLLIQAAPVAQMSPPRPPLSQLSAQEVVANSNPSVPSKVQMAPGFAIGHEIQRTPTLATEREIIDLTLIESSPRQLEADQDSSDDEAESPTLGRYKPIPTNDSNVELKQEPRQVDSSANLTPKKSRQLILPNSTKARPVGTYGVDVAAMPEAPQPPAAPLSSTSTGSAPASTLTDPERNKERNKLGDHLFTRLDSRIHPYKQQSQRTERRRLAAIIEKKIFNKSRTLNDYHQWMNWAAHEWMPKPGKKFQFPNMQVPKGSAEPLSAKSKRGSLTSQAKQHLQGNGKPQSTVLNTHFSMTSRNQPSPGFSKQRMIDPLQQHSPGYGQPSSTILGKYLAMHHKKPGENSEKDLESHSTTSERTNDTRSSSLHLLKHACTQAYEEMCRNGLIEAVPAADVIADLAEKIEEEANQAGSDIDYMWRLEPPSHRILQMHLRGEDISSSQ